MQCIDAVLKQSEGRCLQPTRGVYTEVIALAIMFTAGC